MVLGNRKEILQIVWLKGTKMTIVDDGPVITRKPYRVYAKSHRHIPGGSSDKN